MSTDHIPFPAPQLMANPFEQLETALARRFAEVIAQNERTQIQLLAILAKLGEKPAEWEPLPQAARRLHKNRRTLMKFLHDGALPVDGKIRCRREPSRGGNDAYLLHREDLEAVFPSRS